MNFGNVEKIEELILRPSKNFSIKNTVVLGRRNSRTGFRIDCFKESTYASKKYSDYKYVGNLYIESSDFLVFSCKSDNTNKLVEIYSSYQHIQKIRNGFNEMVNNIDNAFDETKEGVITLREEYSDFVVSINNLINNHSIKLIFDVDYNEDAISHKYERAITIFFNDENLYTTITDENLQGIAYFLENFNLLSSSQHLKQMAYMQQMAYAMDLENREMLPTEEYSGGTGGTLNNKPKRNFKKTVISE